MIECDNPSRSVYKFCFSWHFKWLHLFSRAPTDCLQYFTGTGGIIESFNNPTGMIQNQEYDVCIRQIDGFCSYEIAEANSGTPDAFELPPVAADVAKVSFDDQCSNVYEVNSMIIILEQIGNDCAIAWIVVPTSGIADKHCGKKLSDTSANTVSGTVSSKFLNHAKNRKSSDF